MSKASVLIIGILLMSNALCCQSEDYTIFTDLAYLEQGQRSNDSLQRLNLVLPSGQEKVPLLIWIGGGAWSYGDRNQEMDLAKKFARAGIAVASIGHRLSPAVWRDSALNTGVQHPRHAEDVAAAVHWLYQNAAAYGYDSEGFFIGGYSSGGHLAALISLDSTYLNQVGLSPRLFRGVIPISGTYDIEDYHRVMLNSGRPELAELHVEAVFGGTKEGFKQASPVTYLSNLSTPILLISDNNMYDYARVLEAQIRQTDFRDMQVVYSYGLSHGELWRELSFAEESVHRELIRSFIAGR